MLLFLSSGARERYREDIVRSLALPDDGLLQFRYDLSIVHDKLVEDARSGRLQNADALICYAWTGTKGAPTDFVPCRFARVADAQIVGSSFVVRFEVTKYAPLDKGVQFVSSADQKLLPRWERSGEEWKLSGLFAISLEAKPTIQASGELDAFESIVRRLRGFSDFSGEKLCQFFAVTTVSSVMRDSQGREIYDRMQLSRYGSYMLKSGVEYELQLYVFAPDSGPAGKVKETSISIESESKLVEFPQGKSREIDSEYDIKRFRFLTTKNVYTFSASLMLYLGKSDERSCDITLPVVFDRDISVGIVRMILIAIGSSVPAMLAAWAADKLSLPLALIMLIAAAATGAATVYFTSQKS
jgi:hypothetical protein